jgi:NAD+ synthase
MEIDPAAESHRLAELLRRDVHKRLRRRGAVVGVSGGVDSAVVLALCVRALGSERVLGLLMPERESGTDGERLAHLVAEQLNVETVVEDITPALEGFRCYARRDEAVSRAFPDFERGRDRVKIALPGNVLEHDTLNVFTLSVIDHAGREHRVRLGPGDLNQIVAASNFKQRTRMSLLYYHAELRGYAVIGTPNKDEHDQGFFVKWGDGGYDIGPIRHLYKTQVYQLAEYLDIPDEIRAAIPTSDTYSADASQEKFFFRMPFEVMDVIWHAMEEGIPARQSAQALDLEPGQVERAYAEISRKIATTDYLRTGPISYGTKRSES